MSISPVTKSEIRVPVFSRDGSDGIRTMAQEDDPPPHQVMESPVAVSDRIIASLDRVGNQPGTVTVYTAPMGDSVMTDVRVRLTDSRDGTRIVRNHYGTQEIVPPRSGGGEGISTLATYEDSARAARTADLYFQGLKINRHV
jgi:hypothetical protein